MKFKIRYLFFLLLSLIAVAISYYYLFENSRNLFYFISVASGIIFILPILIDFLFQRAKQKEKEAKFLEFTRDLVESVKSGTPINKSIINLQRRDYGSLSENIKKLANQIHFGINLEQAFSTFANETKSPVISRAIMLISEAQRAGGKIDNILESVSESVSQIEDLKKERMSSIFNLIVQGYIIFFVFIIIMLILENLIVPMALEYLQNQTNDFTTQNQTSNLTPEQFAVPLFLMILFQSLFAGLVIGKIAEGSIFEGIKHSFLLLTITLLIVTGTKAILG